MALQGSKVSTNKEKKSTSRRPGCFAWLFKLFRKKSRRQQVQLVEEEKEEPNTMLEQQVDEARIKVSASLAVPSKTGALEKLFFKYKKVKCWGKKTKTIAVF